jgi:hypothetical protein
MKTLTEVLNAVSIDGNDAENRYRFEPADEMTPDRVFDRTWAMTLLDRVLGLLAQDYAAKGRADVFDRLKLVLSRGKGAVLAAELAAQLGTKEGAVHISCTGSRNAIARSSNGRLRPRSTTPRRSTMKSGGSSGPYDSDRDASKVVAWFA